MSQAKRYGTPRSLFPAIFSLTVFLAGCSSHPRFVHQGGEKMFDTKTAQTCWSGAAQKDDGIAAMSRAYDELEKLSKEDDVAFKKCLSEWTNPNGPEPHTADCQQHDLLLQQVMMQQATFESASNRVMFLQDHPDQKPIIHVEGLPYCSELASK